MSGTRWFSLRHRLTALLLGGVTVCWMVALVWTFIDTHHEVDELLDAQLAQSAQVLMALGGQDSDDDNLQELEGTIERHQRELMFQVWSDHGELMMRSSNAPEQPLTEADGYSEGDTIRGHWRYFSQMSRHRHDPVRVIVAEDHEVREELINGVIVRMMVPAAISLLVLGAWIWIAARRGLAPIDTIAHEVGEQAPERLQPIEPKEAPEEIRPLLVALNRLFGRVEHTLENERRFTADAAHELRTPLAALAAQAHVATRARDEAERQHALELLAGGMSRTSHLVDQLLTLARLEPEQATAPTTSVRLDELAQEVCADHGSHALDKDISLELDAAPVTIAADRELLRILLRNLVDNALRYTPAGGRVHVWVTASDGKIEIKVTDSGPGIPPEKREHVFERFARLAGQEIEGSGLGLSIVRRIVQRHGAQIRLDSGDEGKGLAVIVTFAA